MSRILIKPLSIVVLLLFCGVAFAGGLPDKKCKGGGGNCQGATGGLSVNGVPTGYTCTLNANSPYPKCKTLEGATCPTKTVTCYTGGAVTCTDSTGHTIHPNVTVQTTGC